jgi:PAT family acetyl-CoA transporter-like MFS transporter 1
MESTSGKRGLSGEYGNIFLLLVLYTLQGIPMGLAKVVPMMLVERGASYSNLGTFSLQVRNVDASFLTHVASTSTSSLQRLVYIKSHLKIQFFLLCCLF